MKTLIGFALILGAIVLGFYLCIVVMLYRGIMQAVENWGINNSLVVWGIIRAVFFEIGAIPSYIMIVIGSVLMMD